MLVSTFADSFDFWQVLFTKNLERPKVFLTAEALEPVTVYLFVIVGFDYGAATVGTESTCSHIQGRI